MVEQQTAKSGDRRIYLKSGGLSLEVSLRAWFLVQWFIIYNNEVDVGLHNLIRKFDNATKINRSLLTKTDKASKKIFIKFQLGLMDAIGMCQVHQVETRNKKFNYEMRGVKLKSVQCAKNLGAKITSNLKLSQQCVDAANKANRMLGFIKRNSSTLH